MDNDTYEQTELPEDFVGERAAFLQDGMTVTLELHDERPIGIKLPDYVTLEIVEADPVVKGQTAVVVLQSRPSSRTACASWCRPSSPPAKRSSSTPTK